MASILNNIDTLQENVAGGDLSFGDYLRNLKILQEAQKDLDSGKYPGSGMDMFGVVRDSFQKKVDDIKGNLEAQSEKYMGGGGGDRFDMPPADKVKELPPEQQDVMDSIKVTKLLDKDKKSKTKKDLGFFGNMIETLKTDADAREKFFDQLGTIGGEISRPTDPGEARSLARDLIVGSQKGQGLTAAKAKAEAENLAQIAKARKDANPLQFASSSYKQALEAANAMVQQGKLSPNTPEYFAFIEDRMTSLGLGSQVTSIMSAITQAQEKLVFLEDETQRSNMENLINNLQNEIFNILGGSSSAGTSQTQKDFMNEIDATQN